MKGLTQSVLQVFFVALAATFIIILAFDLAGDESLLESVFSLFKNPQIAIGLTLAILVAGVTAAGLFAAEVRQRRAPIVTLTAWLIREASDQQRFAERVDDFAAALPAVHAPLVHAWEEFSETLLRPDPSRVGEPIVVRNTVRPSSYFNVQATVEAGFGLPFWQALPNYFVGFGLLCTFLGLVSGLHFAADGVAGADVSVARQALQDLLRAATFKFLTSIAGVLASLGLSVFVRAQTQRLQRALDDLCNALEARMVLVTPESLGLEQLREQQRLAAAMERFNTDFAVQLADALEQRLTRAMTGSDGRNVIVSAIQNLETTFRENSGDMGRDISETVLDGLSTPLTTLTDAMTVASR